MMALLNQPSEYRALPKRELALSTREILAATSSAPVRASIFRACAASGVALGSMLARTVVPNAWEAPNDLENSEDCRSAGGHGNQHVRLRSAQLGSKLINLSALTIRY